MEESPAHKRPKRQRFQPFVIKKGIVMRAKQRQKTALELSKSKNDSTMNNDPKVTQLKYNNRSLSKALSEQKIENKCLMDDKVQLQRDLLANHELILALRSELQTHEDDLLQIHEVFRSSLQLLVTLTGHLNVGLQRCTAGRRRSKSVSLGAAGLPARPSRSLSLAGHAAQAGGADSAINSPRQSGAGRKLHKVLPTVAGNVISHPSIVLPRLPAGGGWLVPPPAGAHRGTEAAESMDEEEQEEEEETEEEPEPLAEPANRGGPVSAPLADLSVILEQSVLDADRSATPARRSGSLPLPQVVVPAEERLYGDEAWMRQRTPGRERVVVAAEERLFGDEAWRRQRRRGPARVLVQENERLSGEEAWRRSGSGPLESPAGRAQGRAGQGRPSGTGQGRASGDTGPPEVVSGAGTPTGRGSRSPAPQTERQSPPLSTDGRSPATRQATLCNGDAPHASTTTPSAAAASPAADLEESVVIQRRAQRPRVHGRPSAAAMSTVEKGPPPPASEAVTVPCSADPDESVIISRRNASPPPEQPASPSPPPTPADPDESIIVSRKPPAAPKPPVSEQEAPVSTVAEPASVPQPAAVEEPAPEPAAPVPAPAAVPASPVEQEADQSVIISRKVRRQPRGSVAAAPTAEDADQSVVIARKVRRPGSVASAAPAPAPAPASQAALEEAPAAPAPAAAPVEEGVRSEQAPVEEPAALPAVAELTAAETAGAVVSPALLKPRKRKKKPPREKRLSFIPQVPTEAPDSAAAAAEVICREEATPSPELVVKERYRHMLGKRSPRKSADNRVVPASADDPLEGPSNRVWVAAPPPTARRPRARPRSSRPAAPADSVKQREKSQLASPVVVVVDRAAVGAADSPAAASNTKHRRRSVLNGAAGDAQPAAAAAEATPTGDGGDGRDSASPPSAKRGRSGRPKGPGGRPKGRGRGGRSRQSLSVGVATEGTAERRDPELFVYPELRDGRPEPEQGPEPEPEPPERRPFAGRAAGGESSRPGKKGKRDGADAVTQSAAGPAESPESAEPPAPTESVLAETATPDSEPAAQSEPDSASANPTADTPTTSPVILAEPTSTTEPPPAAESSTTTPPTASPARPLSPAPSLPAPPSDPPAAERPPSPEPLPWTALPPPAPDSPARTAQWERASVQSSPGSEDGGAGMLGGRRRRKQVSYAEPRLNKKLRR